MTTVTDPIRVVDFAAPARETTRRRLADLPGRVVKGDPRHESRPYFASPDGGLIAGTWTSTPGKWHAFTGRDEFCQIQSGRGALISQDGVRHEFGPGSSFLIPDGFRGFWEILETTTKIYVIRDRADEDAGD